MLTIVTGASQNHSKSLKQFLGTIKNIKVSYQCYVYDLGLEKETFEDLKKIYPDFIYRTFDYSKYPDYFNIKINAGEYAWKPVIIEEVCKEVKTGILLWSDSGNKIVSNLVNLYKVILNQGIYSGTSEGFIPWLMYPKTLDYIQEKYSIEKDFFIGKTNKNAAYLGFNLDSEEVQSFIHRFSDCAQHKECIAPEGSHRMNHRQDQAVFTALYHIFMKDKQYIEECHEITTHNDID
jgi:hypothetical protein